MEPVAHSQLVARQRIVVGNDGSPSSQRALEWAVQEATQRGADLDVVIAWDVPYKWAEGFNEKWIEDEEFFANAASDRATASVEELLDGKPWPDWLHVRAQEGLAAAALLEHARTADLLVVGARGRGGFVGLLLGSVSTACVHHAPCPVTVVPAT